MGPFVLGSSMYSDIVEQNQSKLSCAIFIETGSLEMFSFIYKKFVNRYVNVYVKAFVYLFLTAMCV